jgi:hypothetical protein
MPTLITTGSMSAKGFGFGTSSVPSFSGALWTWGNNASGQLGLGNKVNYSSPKQVGALTDWVSISSGGGSNGFSLATKKDGTLWSWGSNNSGQLGLSNYTYYSSPKQVGALTNWSKVSSGGGNSNPGNGFSLSIKKDGTLWAWGFNNTGQLGTGTFLNLNSPTQVGSLTNWLSVSCGNQHSAAVKTDNTLWTWGNGAGGALGRGNTTSYNSPKQVGTLTNWLNVCAGSGSTFAIKTDGTLWAWGSNSNGQLGLGNITYYSSPKQVGSLTNWYSISAFTDFAVAIKTDGTLWAWGSNNNGQLGLGNTTYYSSPKQVGSLTNWYSCVAVISFSSSSVIARKTDGTLWSWGRNLNGVLGLGNITNYSSPKQIGLLNTWKKTSNNSNVNSMFGII